jgi:hypothetical protein
MAMTDPARPQELAARIAGFGLEGSHVEPVHVPSGLWSLILSTLVRERLTGVATAAAGVGELRLPGTLAEEQLLEAQRNAMLWSLSLERKLVTVAAALRSAGIDVVVLKGPALARTVYPEPSWRPFGDLDLLVRTRDWDRTTALLGDLDMRRRLPEPRPGFDKRFGKAAAFIDRDDAEFDLHRTLTPGPFGLWIDTDELVDRAVTFDIAGRRLLRLDDTAQLIHASLHASLGWRPPLLWTLRDVAQCARFASVDWTDLATLSDRWRLGPVLAHAFQAAIATFAVDLPEGSDPFQATRSSRQERRLLEAYTTDRRGRGGTAVATIQALPNIRSKASYLWALLVPNREFLTARTGTDRPSYLRRWKVPLGWASRRWRRESLSRWR